MATQRVQSKKPKVRFRARLLSPAAFIALLGALFVVAPVGGEGPAHVAASTAPSAPSALGQPPVGVATSGRPASSCSNISATVTATLSGADATGTISGDINGPVTAHINSISPSSPSGDGALHVLMEHHYTNTTPSGTVDTSDHAVLAPVDPSAGLYRMNNRLTIVGGNGIYSGASGYIHTHGDVNLFTGSINLSLRGRLCV